MSEQGTLRLITLGTLELQGTDASAARALLAQPKRVALLTYLALATPRGFQQRDLLLALLWPEFDQARARNALSQALYHLRQALGADAVLSRGTEALALDTTRVWCDVAAFETHLEKGERKEALALYRGDLLPGLFLTEAPEFEHWLEQQRARLRELAGQAAGALAESHEASGDAVAASHWAKQAADLAPLDETALRRLIALLARVGERSGALRAYRAFADRLQKEFGAEPAPETKAQIAAVRDATAAVVRRDRQPPPPRPKSEAGPDLVAPPAAPARGAVFGRWGWLAFTAGAATVLTVAAVGRNWLATLFHGTSAPGRAPAWILVAQFDGPADDPTLGTAARDLVQAALDQSRVFATVSDEQVRLSLLLAGRPETTRVDGALARELAYRSSVRAVVEGRVARVGAGFSVVIRAVDVDSGGRVLASVAQTARNEDALVAVLSGLARGMRSALGERQGLIQATRPLDEVMTPSFAAFRKYREAMVVAGAADFPGARRLFREALALDPNFGEAWEGIATSYANQGNLDSAKVAYREALRRPDRFSDVDHLLLEADVAEALRYDLPASLRALNLAVRLKPHCAGCLNDQGWVLAVMGRWDEALASFQLAVASSPLGPPATTEALEALALIMLGRQEEASHVVGGIGDNWVGRHARLWVAATSSDWAAVDSLARVLLSDPSTPDESRIGAGEALAAARAARGGVAAADSALDNLWANASRRHRWNDAHAAARDLLLLRLAASTPIGRTEAALELDPSLQGLLTKGLWAAAGGDTAEARSVLAAVRRRGSDDLTRYDGDLRLIEGLIAARAGLWESVVHTLTPVATRGGWVWKDVQSSLPARWLVADAYQQIGRFDSAAVYFERTVSPVSLGDAPERRGITYSFARERLVLLYARMGRPDDAQRHWDLLRATWTNVDGRLLPQREQAREALARLKSH